MYHICHAWDDARHTLSWGVHDGATYIKRGFKTRKAAREWCEKQGYQYAE